MPTASVHAVLSDQPSCATMQTCQRSWHLTHVLCSCRALVMPTTQCTVPAAAATCIEPLTRIPMSTAAELQQQMQGQRSIWSVLATARRLEQSRGIMLNAAASGPWHAGTAKAYGGQWCTQWQAIRRACRTAGCSTLRCTQYNPYQAASRSAASPAQASSACQSGAHVTPPPMSQRWPQHPLYRLTWHWLH